MGKSVVILLPDIGGQNKVQRGDILPPGKLIADFQPFGMLCGHRIDDADKRLIRSEETVAPGEDVTFQPAFAHVFGKIRVHNAAVFGELIVVGIDFCVKVAVRRFKSAVKPIRHAFVRAERAEIFAVFVETEDVADVTAQFKHILRAHGAGGGHVDSIFFEIGQAQVAQKFAAVRMRIGADPAVSFGGGVRYFCLRARSFESF